MGISEFGRGKRSGEELRRVHPDKPWMWREEWASGRIPSSIQAGLLFGWVFTAIWNLSSWGLVWLVWPEDWRSLVVQGDYRFLIPLAFPLIGLLMLGYAIKSTLAWWKFGSSVLVLESIPGVIGGWLEGAIHTRINKAPAKPFLLSLSCTEQLTTQTRSKGSRKTRWNVLWSHEDEVASERLYPAPSGLAVPVSIYIPHEREATDLSDPDRQVRWRLEASAETTGLNYKAAFEVPVFVTSDSHPETREERLARTSRVMETAEAKVDLPTEVQTRSIPEGIEYDFRIATTAAQGLGCGGFTVAVAALSGAGFFLGWPGALSAGLAIMTLICLILLSFMFFSMERLTLAGRRVVSRRYLFGIPFGSREASSSDVTRAEATLLVDAGNKHRSKRKRNSWQVTLHVAGQDPIEVGALADKRVAVRLAAEIEKRILDAEPARD